LVLPSQSKPRTNCSKGDNSLLVIVISLAITATSPLLSSYYAPVRLLSNAMLTL